MQSAYAPAYRQQQKTGTSQAETRVALASLALKSTKKLFQKGNLENKIWRVIPNLSGANVCAQSVGIDPSFRIKLCGNPALNWRSFVGQSCVKWLPQSYYRTFGTDIVYLQQQENSNGGLLLLTQGCVYANCAEIVTNGQDFSLQGHQRRDKSGITCSERLFMIYWIIKNECVDVNHYRLIVFTHCGNTHNCVQTSSKSNFCVLGPL